MIVCCIILSFVYFWIYFSNIQEIFKDFLSDFSWFLVSFCFKVMSSFTWFRFWACGASLVTTFLFSCLFNHSKKVYLLLYFLITFINNAWSITFTPVPVKLEDTSEFGNDLSLMFFSFLWAVIDPNRPQIHKDSLRQSNCRKNRPVSPLSLVSIIYL